MNFRRLAPVDRGAPAHLRVAVDSNQKPAGADPLLHDFFELGGRGTPAEDAQLLVLLHSKMDRPSIARKLKRPVVAITTRLKVLRATGVKAPK